LPTFGSTASHDATIPDTSQSRSVTRGLPSLLLRLIPEDKAVPAFDRTWLAVTLTLQTFSGAILGIAAEALLAVGLILYLMPRAGLDLLDLASAVAAFDLPARIGPLLAGSL
jgi:hypothetical protein